MAAVLFCLLWFTFGPISIVRGDTCRDVKADVIFLLDGSMSVGATHFQTQLQFVTNFTYNFNIGPNNVQIGLGAFGTAYHNVFYLNTYTNKVLLAAATLRVTPPSGSTHTEEALRFVREQGFSPAHGGRGVDVPKLVVIITDGDGRSNYTPTATEAALLRQAGIRVIRIRIGIEPHRERITQTVSDPRYALYEQYYDYLYRLQSKLENIICAIPHDCGSRPVDIVFALDTSSSVALDAFKKELDFVTDFVSDYDVGPRDVQYGLLTYSTAIHNEFYLNSFKDKMAVLDAIAKVRHRSGTRATDMALNNARLYQFSPTHGARQNASHVLILMTGGRSDDTIKTLTEARYLKNMGVTIVTIGAGRQYDNQYEVNGIATDKSHAHSAGSFSIVHTFKADIEAQICGNTAPRSTPYPECGQEPADVVFVLESSVVENHLQRQLDFVADFADQFKLGPQGVQVSVVTFNSKAFDVFPLDHYADQASLILALNNVTYSAGASYTDMALNYVRTQSLLSSSGGRHGVKKIVILITDGNANHPNQTVAEANLLKTMDNVTVVTIGIGQNVDHTELARVASDSQHTLSATSYRYLSGLVSEMTFVTCHSCEFLRSADIVFMVDMSYGITTTDHHKQLNFVSRVVNDLNIGYKHVRVAVLTYSTNSYIDAYLGTYGTKDLILPSIQRQQYRSGARLTDRALRYAREQLFTSSHGDRPGIKDYLVLLTHGPSLHHTETVKEADLTRQNNVTIITIGIGSKVNKTELDQVASDPQHVLYAKDYDALLDMRLDLESVACRGMSTGGNVNLTTLPSLTVPPRKTTTTTATPTATTTTQTYDRSTATTHMASTTGLRVDCIYENQTFADPNSVSRYYRCTSGKLLHETCPPGNYFNPSNLTCTVQITG